MTEFLERLASIIRTRRQAMSISQERLAEIIDKSPSFVGQLERGESLPSIETLYTLVNFLDIDVSSLFWGPCGEKSDVDEICNLVQHMDDKKEKLMIEYAKLLSKFDL